MSMELNLKGLEDLNKDLQECIARYPDETDKAMRRFANQWVKDCNAKMPGSYQSGKRPLTKSWKKDISQTLGVATEVEIRNRSPHFHLVENGHRKFINGKDTGGFVAGKHYAERTREEWRESYPDKVQEVADTLLKGSGL